MTRLLLGIGLLLSIAGCGYSTGTLTLPANYHTIAVEPFANKVGFLDAETPAEYVPQLEGNVRTAIINKFLSDGIHIADAGQADLVMEGELLALQEDAIRVDVNQNVQQYRVHVVVSVMLKDRLTGKILWSEPSFVGETTYSPSNVTQSNVQNASQAQALTSALDDLATRLVERTAEDW